MASRTRLSMAWVHLALLLAPVTLSAQESTGQITGRVVDPLSQQPIAGAYVYVEGTSFGALTRDNGSFLILGVPPGTYNVVAQFIGYHNGRHENVQVRAGQATTLEFELRVSALRLEEVVVTGTVDPIAGVKVPFTVGKVTKADIPVTPRTTSTVLQGKVAGVQIVRTSGQPGSGADILLRGAKSIARSESPLVVVDGVILGDATLVDIDPGDIESVEVVKGAAAASLYGSRASAGVIQIMTSRGRDVAEGNTRITVRSEFGRNDLPLRHNYITRHHHYLVDPEKGWVDAAGNPVSKENRVTAPDLIADRPYPGPVYDHLRLFFDPGEYVRTSVSIAQNTRSTNFLASFNYQEDEGVVLNNGGSRLYGLRVNLDHRLRSDLNFSVSTYYSRYHQDDFGTDVFYDLMFMPPDVDLRTPNPDGEPYIIQPDPFTLQENPLYALHFLDAYDRRTRYLGSLTIRYSPINWFSLEANASFDRSDRYSDEFVPKGYKALDGSPGPGEVEKSNAFTQALNASVTASFLYSLGDLTARTRFQYLVESERNEARSASGNTLSVIGVPQVNVGRNRSGSSSLTEIRSAGFFAITGLDYRGKYIADALIRRDGSSLFGPQSRWHTYYRLSGAWRVSQEPWWFSEALNEFKLRYSVGTAGGRPNFSDRFEVWSVSANGNVSKGVLGNRSLRPEKQTEQEFGLDIIAFDRISLQLTHARSKVEDLLLSVPLSAPFGFSSQWQNAGTLESKTWEATFEATLRQTADTRWSISLIADRTRSKITEFNRSCYRDDFTYYCAGQEIGVLWGYDWLRSHDELPAIHAGSHDQFQVNDDGLLVPVGAGNSYRDGRAKGLWGTKVTIDGVEYDWGLPIMRTDENGVPILGPIGNTNPDLNLGLASRFQWKGLSVYLLLHSQIGGDIYNETRQWAYRESTHADYDQSGKPDELRKPVTYYQALYSANSDNSWFVEDATYLKVRELSVQYRFNRAQIQRLLGRFGVEEFSIGLAGRNLYTLTNYFGFDPETGSIRQRDDNFRYPNFRTFTLSMDVTF